MPYQQVGDAAVRAPSFGLSRDLCPRGRGIRLEIIEESQELEHEIVIGHEHVGPAKDADEHGLQSRGPDSFERVESSVAHEVGILQGLQRFSDQSSTRRTGVGKCGAE